MSSPTLPFNAKPSSQAKIKVVLFGIIGLFLVFGAVYLFLANITVASADGQTVEPMSLPFKLLLSAVMLLVAGGCFRMLWVLIPVLIGKRPAAIITERGIESAYLSVNLFAFTTVVRAHVIPWAALKQLPSPSHTHAAANTDVHFRIRASAVTEQCGSKTVQRALKNMESSTLSIALHISLTPEETALVRTLMPK